MPNITGHNKVDIKIINFLSYPSSSILKVMVIIVIKVIGTDRTTRTHRTTAVQPGIYELAFTMNKWFLTDNSATVSPILMISSADPHEILILIRL